MELAHASRVIILVDMDCFYCQVEENLNPYLCGKPIAVVQYNAWRGGGIIAVNYPARDRGVTRHMRGDEAKKKCPDIELIKVPCVREKADLSKYRDAGKRVAEVLQTFTDLLERASVDEAYLDITSAVNKKIQNSGRMTIDLLKNTHVVGCTTQDFLENHNDNECFMECNVKLAMGGIIAEEIRATVYKQTGYKCSAGIAHNKVLAKLACGLHKPNQQTILPQESVKELYEDLPLRKIRSLGGKFGDTLAEDLRIKTMGELIKFTEKELIQRYDTRTGSWLYKIARGIDMEPVTTRLVSKSIGCCKKFPGRTALIDIEEVAHWINELAIEISERLDKDMEENNRRARQMVVSFVQETNKRDISNSRTHVLNSYDAKKIATDAFEVIKKNCRRSDNTFHLKFLGISVGKFEGSKNIQDISSYFIAKPRAVSETVTQNSNQQNNKGDNTIFSFIKNMERSKIETELLYNDKSKATGHNKDISELLDNNRQMLDNDKNKVINDNKQHILLNNFKEPTDAESNLCDKYHTNNCNSVENIFACTETCNEEEEFADVETSSVFSAETEALTYNEQDYVFDENYSEVSESFAAEIFQKFGKTVGKPEIAYSNARDSDSDTDSITDEIFQRNRPYNKSRSETSRPNSVSYFSEYFSNLKDEKLRSPVERNFDTSRHLREDDLNSESETSDSFSNSDRGIECTKPIKNYINPCTLQPDYVNVTPSTSCSFINQDSKEICPECNKWILKSDMVEHVDYHFALNLEKEEAYIYKTRNLVKTEPKKKGGESKSVKRKFVDDRCAKLTSFLQTNVEAKADEPSELCAECNKKISTKGIQSHMDYHLAKKLHMEINPVKTCSVQSAQENKNKRDSKNSKIPSITSFFKLL